MIQFTLKCPSGHRFDSWFQSAQAFDTLSAQGHVSCAVCGDGNVEKAVMAPRVARSDAAGTLSAPASGDEGKMAATLRGIEDVGRGFAAEARAIHDGSAPRRAIRGEARIEEARSLLNDGIPILPLPVVPKRRTN